MFPNLPTQIVSGYETRIRIVLLGKGWQENKIWFNCFEGEMYILTEFNIILKTYCDLMPDQLAFWSDMIGH